MVIQHRPFFRPVQIHFSHLSAGMDVLNPDFRKPVIFAWSGGKDSAYALFQIMKSADYEVRYLLSTFNGNNRRLSMHGVREELIEAQAKSIGIPLIKMTVYQGSNEEYESRMSETLRKLKSEGIEVVAFGDIFLEDLRLYRENQMRKIGMECLFPIWKKDTRVLINQFLREGFKTIICCISDVHLDETWCGRILDEKFIHDLPVGVDPCGENGEFHSFCYEGPIFKKPIPIRTDEKIYKILDVKPSDSETEDIPVKKNGFWFIDLLPENR
jgi:uncharacterized protein (TIGR00290 family)